MRIEGSFDEELAPRVEIPMAGCAVSLVVDTGFNGELMLPRHRLEQLGFVYTMESEAELADGSLVETSLYTGRITWFGAERIVQAIATNSEDGLLGTATLFGITLFMDLDEDKVELEQKKVAEEANR